MPHYVTKEREGAGQHELSERPTTSTHFEPHPRDGRGRGAAENDGWQPGRTSNGWEGRGGDREQEQYRRPSSTDKGQGPTAGKNRGEWVRAR